MPAGTAELRFTGPMTSSGLPAAGPLSTMAFPAP